MYSCACILFRSGDLPVTLSNMTNYLCYGLSLYLHLLISSGDIHLYDCNMLLEMHAFQAVCYLHSTHKNLYILHLLLGFAFLLSEQQKIDLEMSFFNRTGTWGNARASRVGPLSLLSLNCVYSMCSVWVWVVNSLHWVYCCLFHKHLSSQRILPYSIPLWKQVSLTPFYTLVITVGVFLNTLAATTVNSSLFLFVFHLFNLTALIFQGSLQKLGLIKAIKKECIKRVKQVPCVKPCIKRLRTHRA